MKKILAIVTILVLLAVSVVPAFATAPSFSAKVRIEGKTQNLFYDTVTTNNQNNFSIIEVLRLADQKSDALKIDGLDLGYITAINGDKIGKAEGGQDIYVIRVNGEYVPYGSIPRYELKDGDEILVYYSDEFGGGMIFPIVDTSKLESQRYIRFVYEKPSDDGTSFTNESVTGATVNWYCDEVAFTYVTDGQGGIYIDKNAFTSGDHKMTIELAREDGTPALLRLAPDYKVNVPVGIGDTLAVYICAAVALVSLGAIIALVVSLKKKKA